MFLDWLDNMRTKPKRVRVRTAFLIAFSVTLIVGGIWALTLPARLSELSEIGGGDVSPPPEFEEFGNLLETSKNTVEEAIEAAKNEPQALPTSETGEGDGDAREGQNVQIVEEPQGAGGTGTTTTERE